MCVRCSEPLVLFCSSCGSAVPPGAERCPKCGQRFEDLNFFQQTDQGNEPKAEIHERMLRNLRDSIPIVLARKIENLASKMVGQRRDVTVLAARIDNFTLASNRVDPGMTFSVLDNLMHALADVIYEYEGTIDKLFGDNLMALFGLPVNHENDPERAVRASLEMLKVAGSLREQLVHDYGMEINLRIGINTGLVIAGGLGDQHHMEYTVIGDTVNLASHLETMAGPGTAIVSFRTYQRTYPIFHYEPLPAVHFKDFPIPVKVFRPVNVRTAGGRARWLPGLQAPMVGRERDLQRLQSACAQVIEQKSSQVVLLSGEGGIGKTRLVSEFFATLAGQPVKLYSGSCASYMRITPYRVVADLVRDIIHVSEVDPNSVQREALSYSVEQLNLDGDKILPYLNYVLGIGQSDPLAELRLQLLDPAMLQRQIHSALRSFLVATASQSPVIFVFDDLHWIDPASRDFLAYFIQALENIPLMLLLIARNFDETPDTKPLVAAVDKRGGETLEIHLEPLSSSDSEQLIDRLLTANTTKARIVKEQIIGRAYGNPYYTEELVRLLLDNGGLVGKAGSWLITDAAAHLVKEVPGTLQDLILARFDLLSPELKDTLQRAAVLRGVFSLGLLNQISDYGRDALVNNLRELEQRGFLERVPVGNEDRYSIKHPLLQETIYNTLVTRDLRPLHLKIARAIEEGGNGVHGEQSDILAYHYSESTTPDKAIPYLIASAEKAAQRFANESAAQYYRQALALMEASVEADEMQILQAQLGLGRSLKFAGEYEGAQQSLGGALRRIQQEGIGDIRQDQTRAGLLLESLRELADLRTREGKLELAVQLLQEGLEFLESAGPHLGLIPARRLTDRLAWAYFRQGKLKEAFRVATQALDDAGEWGEEDPITLASLHNTVGGIHWMHSDYGAAIECVKHSLEVYEKLTYFWGMAIAYTNLGVLQHSAGKWAEAIANLEQADAIRLQNGYLAERPTSLKNLGEALVCTGEFDLAREKFETSLAISKRQGMNLSAAYSEIGLCRLAILQDELEEAQAHLDNAETLLGDARNELDERYVELLILQARIYAQKRNYAEATELAQKAHQMATESGFINEVNEALWTLGTICEGLGEYEQAERYLTEVIRLTQAQGDSYIQAQALFDLSQVHLYRSQAEPGLWTEQLQKAKQTLTSSVELFTALGSNYHLARAGIALDQISLIESRGCQAGLEWRKGVD